MARLKGIWRALNAGVPRSQIATEGIAMWLQQHGAE